VWFWVVLWGCRLGLVNHFLIFEHDFVQMKNLSTDECFNDNKPRGINDKFYEWWSTDVCTWVFVKRSGIT